MRITRIFSEVTLEANQQIQLAEKASHHLHKVLRLKPGAELLLFDGCGGQYSAVIDAIEKKSVTVNTGAYEASSKQSPLEIHLGIAISKGDRMDLIMQKATELGVTTITPLISERTEVKLKGERLEKKHLHWQQIIISACEQCGRNQLADIRPLQPIDHWLGNISADKKIVLHHRTDQKLLATEEPKSVALLIGPEGGLSSKEIQRAEERQFNALQLGPRVLRTETAPMAAIAILQYIWGDF